MSEDERLEMLETVLEAHASLADAALELRRRFSRQSPLAKAADKAEQEVFRLKRALQRFDLSDPLPPLPGGPLPEVAPRPTGDRFRAPAALAGSRRRDRKRSAQIRFRGRFPR